MHIQRIFKENSDMMEKGEESANLTSIVAIFLRYMQAGFSENINPIQNINKYKLENTLPTLFSKEEFDKIISCLKFLLSEFPIKAEEAILWLKKDIQPRKKQVEALKDFINSMSLLKEGDQKEMQTKFKQASKKFIDVGTPGRQDNDHNLWTLQQREKFGMFSPEKELLISTYRIFTYLDILSYSRIFPRHENFPEKASDLNFKTRYS